MKCKGDKACAWPIVRKGLCINHLRDASRTNSNDLLEYDMNQILAFLPSKIKAKVKACVPNTSLQK
jgi:hypothetical protein